MFQTKTCPNCGNGVRDEAVFCLDCGKRIDGKSESPQDVGNITDRIDTIEAHGTAPEREEFDDGFGAETDASAFFKVVEGVDKGRQILLSDKKVRIGRLKRNDAFALEDPFVSREHLVISWQRGKFFLESLSDTNGTFVNGARITDHVLAHGDVVEIGYTVMTFHVKAG